MTEPRDPDPYIPPPDGTYRTKRWKHAVLFAATFVTTTLVGAAHYASFLTEFGRLPFNLKWSLLGGGLWYSTGVLAILGAHEMGHYVACRRYQLNASLPYFLPFILPVDGFQTGTLGAIIRIRSAFPTRAVLFDVGVAGPMRRVVVLVRCCSSLGDVADSAGARRGGVYLGDRALQWRHSWFGTDAEGFALNAHPMVFRHGSDAGDRLEPAPVRTTRRRPHHDTPRSAGSLHPSRF